MSRRAARIARLPAPQQPRDVQETFARLRQVARDHSDVAGIGYCIVFRDGRIATGYAGVEAASRHALLAGASVLARRIMDGYES